MKHPLSQFRIRTERIGEAIPAVEADAPEKIWRYWLEHVAKDIQQDKEHLHVLLLNSRLKIIGFHLVSMGSLTETSSHPREVLRPVILAGAYGFVLTHNHPSGDPSPSRGDDLFTRRLIEAADLLVLKFLDHVVIGQPETGRNAYYSYREAGIVV